MTLVRQTAPKRSFLDLQVREPRAPSAKRTSAVVRGILDVDAGDYRVLLQALLQPGDVRRVSVIDLEYNLAERVGQRHALGDRRRVNVRQLAARGPDLQPGRIRGPGV